MAVRPRPIVGRALLLCSLVAGSVLSEGCTGTADDSKFRARVSLPELYDYPADPHVHLNHHPLGRASKMRLIHYHPLTPPSP